MLLIFLVMISFFATGASALQDGSDSAAHVCEKEPENRKKHHYLRDEPIIFSIGSDYFPEPSPVAMKNLASELSEALAACTYYMPNAVLKTGMTIISGVGQFALHTITHELGHGSMTPLVSDARAKYAHGNDKHRPFWQFFFTFPRLWGHLASTHSPYKFPDNEAVVVSKIEDVGKGGLDEIKPVLTEQGVSAERAMENYRKRIRSAAAGFVAEGQLTHSIARKILSGDVMRWGAFVLYISSKIGQVTYSLKEGDQKNLQKYYDFTEAGGLTRKARNLALLTVFSGTTFAYVRAWYNDELVRPFWLFDRILLPDFYQYLSEKGLSVLVESAVRISDDLNVSFGYERIIDGALKLPKRERYQDSEFRMGVNWCICKGLRFSGYSLIARFGGEVELKYVNTQAHFGLSVGVAWASDKTLLGDRIRRDFAKERSVEAFARISGTI